MENKYLYKAFISYNSRDEKWAKWLQKSLERYTLPSIIANERGEVLRSYDKSLRHFKIFRDATDLVGTNLHEALPRELDNSEYLVVICSPNSAQSKWVGDEIQKFIDSNRSDKIIPFIVDGKPYSDDDFIRKNIIEAEKTHNCK